MAKKFSIKKLLFVGMLSIAGLFGVSSVAINKHVETVSESQEAKAAKPDTIYFTITTGWGGGNSYDNLWNHTYVYFYGSCDSGGSNPQWAWQGKKISEIEGATILTNSYSHLNIASIPNKYHHANVIFSTDKINNDSKKTEDLTIPTDGKNFYMLLSNQDSGYVQYGDWLKFDAVNQRLDQNNVDWTQSTLRHKTDTLFFTPSQEWCTNRGDDGRRIWPRLTVTFPTITVGGVNYTSIEMYPTGITEPSPNWVTNADTRLYVFYYDNIPLTTLNSAYFVPSESNHKTLRLNSDQRSCWYNSTDGHVANVFGSQSYNWASWWNDTTVTGGDTYTGYYDTQNRDSKAFLVGDFLLNQSINWNENEWPQEYNALVNDSDDNYSKTLRVVKGDMFKYVTYRCLANISVVSDGSNWGLYDKQGPHGYYLPNVTIYDKDGKVVNNKNEYIFNDGTAFRFLKSGIVKFRRRNIFDYLHADLELWFYDDTETNSNYYLVGEGSFVNGTPTWDTNTGVRMKDDSNNNAFLRNQLLKKGDIFAIKDTSGNSYAWDDTGNVGVYNNNFSPLATGNIMWTVNGNVSGNNVNAVKGTYGAKTTVPAGACTIYITVDNPQWVIDYARFGIQSLDSNRIMVGTLIEGEYGTSGLVVQVVIPYSFFSDGIQIARMNSSCEDGKEYSNDYRWNFTTKNCPANSSSMKTVFECDSTKVYTLNTGYYNICLNTSNKVHISSIDDFLADDAVYLDLGTVADVKTAWSAKNIGVRFWNSADTGTGTNVAMYGVHGHSLGESRYLFEANIPVLGNGRLPNMVLFYADTDIISQEDTSWDFQTQDQARIVGLNVCQLTGDTSSSKYTCTWPDIITNEDRAEIYGDYFNDEIECNDGVTAPKRWDALIEPATSNVNTEYQHICKNAQGVIWLAHPNEEGNSIEQAMSKYDYIVIKYLDTGRYPDFINRKAEGSGSPTLQSLPSNKGHFDPFNLSDDASFAKIIIIIASSISLLSITALSVLVIKKRKTKEQ